MKKSLLALALLGAFTASAFAEPSVTLYGRIDTGLVYTHKNLDNTAGSTDTFSMDSGVTTGSRWGLKGSEDIGNAKVGFVLESGFNSDDGTSGQNNRLFGREAQVNISGAYGTLYAGRLASIASDSGSIGYLGDVSAFPSAYGFVGNQQGSTGTAYGRYDNTLAYETPTFGGLQGATCIPSRATPRLLTRMLPMPVRIPAMLTATSPLASATRLARPLLSSPVT